MKQKTPEELRQDFWQSDYERGGVIRSQYDEIKRVLEEKDTAWIEERLLDIKNHAIKQTDFYHDFRVSNVFLL